MLRYRADYKTLIFVAIYFGLVAVQWALAPTNLALAIPLLILTCWFSFFGAVATHNAIHSPVFKSRGMNRLFQVALTLTYGHPVSAYVPGHNLSHHKYTQSRKDVMRTSKIRFRWNLLNGIFFMPRVGRDIFAADMRYFKAMYRRNKPWFNQMLLEAFVFLGSMGALIALDWKKFLLYVLVPHQYAAWGIISMNLLQHDGCDENSDYNHSRNFVGKVVNWFTYNNGFHTIHHMEPGLHWSLAPAEHAKRVAPFIHPNLDQASLLGYLFRTYISPGKRVMYTGEPLVLPEEGPDEEWIPGPKETPPDVSLGAIA
ncbi:MAG: fatty acid desaturase [Byssovorax sp.]